MEAFWPLVPILILINAYFVICEYALVSIRTSQVPLIKKLGYRRTASAIEFLKKHMASSIGAIQVGITLSNLVLGWLGEPAMRSMIEWAVSPLGAVIPRVVMTPLATGLGFVIVTLLTVVVGELLPKAITLQHTIGMARFTLPALIVIQRGFLPLVWMMNVTADGISRLLGMGPLEIEGRPLSADEIGEITAESGEAGTLTPRQRSLVLNSLALGRKTAEQIMVPRVQVAWLDIQRSMEQNMQVIEEHLFSRFPLCDGGMDHVIGMIYTKEFLVAYHAQADASVLSLLARKAVFAPVTLPLDRLLTTFHEQKSHILLLVDEYGGIDGLVTLTDVVDEVLGEIREG